MKSVELEPVRSLEPELAKTLELEPEPVKSLVLEISYKSLSLKG